MRGVRHALVLLALATTAVAAPEIDDAAPRAGEWGYRPLPDRASATDPPAFVWRPQRGAGSYALQVARDTAFEDLVYERDGLPLHAHAPSRPLGPGSYVWRYRFVAADGGCSGPGPWRR